MPGGNGFDRLRSLGGGILDIVPFIHHDVEPGNLLLLAYKDEVPIVSAPGCFRSAKPNVVDLILPPLLARYRVNGWEIAGLGHGGLLC